MSARLCRVCGSPTPWGLCNGCFAVLYPEAVRRQLDTRQHQANVRTAASYESARAADERDAPKEGTGADVKGRGRRRGPR